MELSLCGSIALATNYPPQLKIQNEVPKEGLTLRTALYIETFSRLLHWIKLHKQVVGALQRFLSLVCQRSGPGPTADSAILLREALRLERKWTPFLTTEERCQGVPLPNTNSQCQFWYWFKPER